MKGVSVVADPGGKDRFGLAFLDRSGEMSCETVSSVDEAVDRIAGKGEPIGLGIDAPMWWSSREGGGRMADSWIRKTYSIKPGTVQTANSLRGAALVGGAMLASRVRQEFPGTRITEAHPKALLQAFNWSAQSFSERFDLPVSGATEHERDAAICAVWAREGFEGRWRLDLALHRDPLEQDPLRYWLAPMHYYWPADLDCCPNP